MKGTALIAKVPVPFSITSFADRSISPKADRANNEPKLILFTPISVSLDTVKEAQSSHLKVYLLI